LQVIGWAQTTQPNTRIYNTGGGYMSDPRLRDHVKKVGSESEDFLNVEPGDLVQVPDWSRVRNVIQIDQLSPNNGCGPLIVAGAFGSLAFAGAAWGLLS